MSRVLTDKQILERLNSPDNLANIISHHTLESGRGIGSLEVPMEIKKTIAILGADGESSNRSIAKDFDISQASVNTYTNGKTTIDGPPNEELVGVIEHRRKQAEDTAIDTLLEAVGLIKPNLKNVKKV